MAGNPRGGPLATRTRAVRAAKIWSSGIARIAPHNCDRGPGLSKAADGLLSPFESMPVFPGSFENGLAYSVADRAATIRQTITFRRPRRRLKRGEGTEY